MKRLKLMLSTALIVVSAGSLPASAQTSATVMRKRMSATHL